MSSKPEVLKFEHWSELPGGLVNTKLLGSVPKLTDPLNPRWDPGIALLMSSQGGVDAASLGCQGPHFENHSPGEFISGKTESLKTKASDLVGESS